jgi:hypothetical protein
MYGRSQLFDQDWVELDSDDFDTPTGQANGQLAPTRSDFHPELSRLRIQTGKQPGLPCGISQKMLPKAASGHCCG